VFNLKKGHGIRIVLTLCFLISFSIVESAIVNDIINVETDKENYDSGDMVIVRAEVIGEALSSATIDVKICYSDGTEVVTQRVNPDKNGSLYAEIFLPNTTLTGDCYVIVQEYDGTPRSEPSYFTVGDERPEYEKKFSGGIDFVRNNFVFVFLAIVGAGVIIFLSFYREGKKPETNKKKKGSKPKAPKNIYNPKRPNVHRR